MMILHGNDRYGNNSASGRDFRRTHFSTSTEAVLFDGERIAAIWHGGTRTPHGRHELIVSADQNCLRCRLCLLLEVKQHRPVGFHWDSIERNRLELEASCRCFGGTSQQAWSRSGLRRCDITLLVYPKLDRDCPGDMSGPGCWRIERQRPPHYFAAGHYCSPPH